MHLSSIVFGNSRIHWDSISESRSHGDEVRRLRFLVFLCHMDTIRARLRRGREYIIVSDFISVRKLRIRIFADHGCRKNSKFDVQSLNFNVTFGFCRGQTWNPSNRKPPCLPGPVPGPAATHKLKKKSNVSSIMKTSADLLGPQHTGVWGMGPRHEHPRKREILC